MGGTTYYYSPGPRCELTTSTSKSGQAYVPPHRRPHAPRDALAEPVTTLDSLPTPTSIRTVDDSFQSTFKDVPPRMLTMSDDKPAADKHKLRPHLRPLKLIYGTLGRGFATPPPSTPHSSQMQVPPETSPFAIEPADAVSEEEGTWRRDRGKGQRQALDVLAWELYGIRVLEGKARGKKKKASSEHTKNRTASNKDKHQIAQSKQNFCHSKAYKLHLSPAETE